MPKSPSDLHAVRVSITFTFPHVDILLAGRKWFDCAQCHQEQESHQLLQTFDMVSGCDRTSILVPRTEVHDRRLPAKSVKSASGKTYKNLRMREISVGLTTTMAKTSLSVMNTALIAITTSYLKLKRPHQV